MNSKCLKNIDRIDFIPNQAAPRRLKNTSTKSLVSKSKSGAAIGIEVYFHLCGVEVSHVTLTCQEWRNVALAG